MTMSAVLSSLNRTPKRIPFCSAFPFDASRADAYPGRGRPRRTAPRVWCVEWVPVTLPRDVGGLVRVVHLLYTYMGCGSVRGV